MNHNYHVDLLQHLFLYLYLNELINDFSNISGFRGQSGKFTPKDEIYLNMFDRVIYQLDKLPNALSIEKTADNKLNTRINVVGDIRGNYDSLTKILNSIGLPSQNNIILFNGDIVDGGNYQLLCWVTILLYRYFYPKALFINKGNHEDIFVNRDYKFIHYYETNYSSYLRRIRDVYNVLPIALNYDKKLFAVHGGLPIKKTMLEDGITMNTFNKDYKRKLYNSTTKYFKLFPTTEEKYDEDILNMIWSDPFFDISEDKFKFAELRQVKKTIEDEMADYMKPFNGFMKNTIKVDKFINLKKEIDLANFRDKGNKHRKEVDLSVPELKKKYNSYKSEMIKLLKLIEEEKKNIEELNQREWKVYTINELRNIIPTMFDDFNIIKHDYSRGDNIYYYDCDDIKKFLKNMKAKFLVRSHQIMQNGFEVYNECPFIYTVTSTAKFYEDNYASYISFDGVNNLIDFYKVY
jgi:diadenosine tetraphosphatase ApaH/serine/threonine PP2A family protein phosphatase